MSRAQSRTLWGQTLTKPRLRVKAAVAALSALATLTTYAWQPAQAQDPIPVDPLTARSQGPTLRVASLNAPAIAPVHEANLQQPGAQASEAAARMTAALEREITADYFDVSFGQVLNDLATQAEVPIILDQAATARMKFRIAGQQAVTIFEAPIIFKASGLPLRSVLDLMLPGLGLTWGIKGNETISITTPLVAENWVHERLFPVSEILAKNSSSVNDPRMGAQVVGDFITKFVAPESWQLNGGTGEIVALDNAILVRATRPVLEEVDRFLNMWANPAARNPQPSQRVIAIRDALAEEIVFDAPEQGLFEVLAEMADRAAIPIVLDFYTLLDARIPYDRPVGFNVSGASLGAVLDLMLDPQGLEAVIYQDALLVTTKRRANELMYVRMYDVRGLLVPPSEGVAAPLTQRTFDSVLDNTVRPESWFSAGGDARRELYVSDGATEVLLFVRQTEAGHADLKERLQQLEQWQSGQ